MTLTGHFQEIFVTVMKYEICALFFNFTQRRLVVSYRRFGATDRVPDSGFKLILYPLKMGPIGCPETSGTTKLRCVKAQKTASLTPQRQPEVTRGNEISWKVNYKMKCECRGI
jgi:hypothetical protein